MEEENTEKEYSDLSNEEKAALIDICKEDPVVFIETVCGIKLLESQKETIRETFEALKKPNWAECYDASKFLGEVIDISDEKTCRTCMYRETWHHLDPCMSCGNYSKWVSRY